MKLIIRAYLASLRERGELDAILPDLLSQLGLQVFSRPALGTRQDGVDVGAVGSLDGGEQKVYLFSIKAGDLTRQQWDGDSIQSLRPSLNEILDAYIPTRVPSEHRGKPIVVCICLGGDVQEQVRPQLRGFIEDKSREWLAFEEWNGDKLAALIQSAFLREDLLPPDARSRLRKSLALVDEPANAYEQFSALIRSFSSVGDLRYKTRLRSMRQMCICLWILFAWCRDAGNTEAAYMAAELTLLHGWESAKQYAGKRRRSAAAIQNAFLSVYAAYHEICNDYLARIVPHASKAHALSAAVRSPNTLDISLKMFDLLGRISMGCLWSYWGITRASDQQADPNPVVACNGTVKLLISNNPVLFLPAQEDQAIDMAIALTVLALDLRNTRDIQRWLRELLRRSIFAYRTHGRYPTILRDYSDLLLHPKAGDDDYRQGATAGSILFPLIAIWAALTGDEETLTEVATLKSENLGHCTFQWWYPDEASEEHLYRNAAPHGATLTDVRVDQSREDLLEQVFGECSNSSWFAKLSAVENGWWPLVFVACRHYRLPIPLHFWIGVRNAFRENDSAAEMDEDESSSTTRDHSAAGDGD